MGGSSLPLGHPETGARLREGGVGRGREGRMGGGEIGGSRGGQEGEKEGRRERPDGRRGGRGGRGRRGLSEEEGETWRPGRHTCWGEGLARMAARRDQRGCV